MIKAKFISATGLVAATLATAALFTLSPAAAQLNLLAQNQKPNAESASDGETSRAATWAREMGEVAGGANYCKLDSEEIENFILQALARIASEAHDDVDQVVSRITFNNTVDTASVKPPKGGCENFPSLFQRELARLGKE